MSSVAAFKLILLSLIAMIVLQLLAKRLRLPPAAALLIGGMGMAFVPGLPHVELDPELVLIVFLPPLLMYGAYFSVWDDFKRNINGILLLAIGAVGFTTLVVGVAVHMVVPMLPWGACFALGAIVSPPDAVAAKAVLERVSLPRRLMVVLEGESLLNDAAGLVLFRFAVAAALTGAFSIEHAAISFTMLAVGGVAIGAVVGYLVVHAFRLIEDEYLIVTASMLSAWVSYILGEMVHASGVIAAVTCGLALGWYQHEIFTASVRTRATSFWQVVIFLFEALVFVLIGLSLRGVMERLGGTEDALPTLAPAVLIVVAVVVVSRFVWVFTVEWIASWTRRLRHRHVAPPAGEQTTAQTASHHHGPDWRGATITSWAGMRGVVTLAIALSLPEEMPGRDLILVASFAVILVTVLLQGTTIGWLIRLVNPDRAHDHDQRHLNEPQAWARIEAAQFAAIKPLLYGPDGTLIHPRLFEQYQYRVRLSEKYGELTAFPEEARSAHYGIVLAAIAAARKELLNLHRSGLIHDELLHSFEHDLDLQEITAIHARGGGPKSH